MLDTINTMVEKFNTKAGEDENIQEKIGGLKKSILLNLTGEQEQNYMMKLDDCKMSPATSLSTDEAESSDPDLRVTLDADIFQKILSKEMNPVKAWAKKQVTFKAKNIKDLLLLKRLF